MKVTQQESAPLQAVLDIEVEPEELDHFLERAYRRLVQRVSIPGFRPGKAPRSVLERVMGREALLNEALDFLVPEMTGRALQEQQLEASALPDVEVVTLEPLVLRATVPLKPRVEVGDYRSLRIPREPVEVKEEQVQGVLEELRHRLATWEPVERPLQMGDLATITVRGEVEGKTVLDQQDAQIVLRPDWPLPLPGFTNALEGMARGEIREFALPFPQDYPSPDMRGKNCHFRVLLKEVKAQRLPELDDDFARAVGPGYAGLEDLRRRIEEDLRAQAERQARREHEERVLQEVVSLSRVELPPLLVEREVDHLLRDQAEALQRQQVTMEEYLQQAGKSTEELREELRPRARERLVRTLVLEAVAEREGVTVSPEEVEAEIARLVAGAGPQGEALRRALTTPRGRESVAENLRLHKTVALLAEMASGEPPQEASGQEGGEEGDEASG